MTDAPTQPTDNATLEAQEMTAMAAAFEEAHKARLANNGAEQSPGVTTAEPAKAAPAAKAADSAPAADEFPSEVLEGKAPEPDPKKKEEEEDLEILKTKPTGQIKHEHYERQQLAANRRVDAANAERDKLRDDLEKLRTSATQFPAEKAKAYEQTQKDLDAARDELKRVAYERTPEFRERFTDREADLVKRAEETAKDFGIDAKVIKNALSASGKARFEILENAGELPASALSYLSNLLANHDQLQSEKASVLSQSKERYVVYEQQQQAHAKAQEAERKQRETEAFDGALAKLSAQFEPFIEVKGNDAWNKSREDDIAAARKLYSDGNASEEELAEVALTAIGAKKLHKMFKTLQSRYNALVQKNAELTAAGPQVNGTGQHRNLTDDSHLSEEQRSMRSWEESMRAAGRM